MANAYLEGTYSEVYSGIEEDVDGLRKLFRQFSFPGGMPSHVAAETPGSIHEGGELGYALVHAYGAAFDNPDLVVACVIGDGEAETGPLAASWHSNKFLNPVTDGAVLPILHLNGYKIANPTVLARIPQDELESLMYGYGYRPITVAGDDPANVHRQLAAALDEAFDQIGGHPAGGAAGRRDRPTAVADDRAAHPEGLDRARRRSTARRSRAPGGRIRCRCPRRTQPRAPGAARGMAAQLPSPRSCSTTQGALRPELRALAPTGQRRMSANPHANGGLLLRDLDLPDFRDYAVAVDEPATGTAEATRVLGTFLRDVIARNPDRFRLMGPDETASNRLSAVFESTDKAWLAEIGPDDEHLGAGRPRDGGALRAPVPGLARGLPADRPARAVQLLRGVRAHRRLDVQPARQMADQQHGAAVAAADRIAELPSDLPCLASGPQRRVASGSRASSTTSPTSGPRWCGCTCRRTPTRCCRWPITACAAATTSTSIVAGKQPALTYLDMDAAIAHCTRGLGIWEWAGTATGEPDVVLACAGDIPTLETLAAADILRRELPELAVRVDQRRRPHAVATGLRASARAVRSANSTRCSPPTSRSSSPTTATPG